MVTYESGKAPADAPVTWRRVTDPDFANYIVFAVTLAEGNECEVSDDNQAEAICQWAHLAALADEAAPVVEAFGTDAGGFRGYWLRRYRAAKGER